MKKFGGILIGVFLMAALMIISLVINQINRDSIDYEVNDYESEVFKYEESSESVDYCYISVLYLDGYHYSPSEWLSEGYNVKHNFTRGQKIGEVTLDLKGKDYTDMPPNFSSTHSVGSEIYEIEGFKKEYAVIFVENGNENVFYNQGKAVATGLEAIDMPVRDLYNLISTRTNVTTVEFRSEENGAWISDLEDEDLNNYLNETIVRETILNREDLEHEPYSSFRIPLNIIFEDGVKLHMQVYPNTGYAWIFGGYVKVSEEFTTTLRTAMDSSDISPNITDLLAYSEEEIFFMTINDKIGNRRFTCTDANWSAGALYSILSYYRVQPINSDLEAILTVELGKSESDKIVFGLHDDQIISIDGEYYQVIIGELVYETLDMFIDTYTNYN